MNKNDTVVLNITSVTSEGHGVAKDGEFVFFVPYAILGEEVLAKVLKVKKNVCYCKIIEVIKPSEARIEPCCDNFFKCGGCLFLNTDYKKQLETKLIKVNDAIKRIGKINFDVNNIIPSPETARYRNKALIPVSEKDGEIICGFYRNRTHDVIPMDDCVIQDDDAFPVANTVTNWMKKYKIAPYSEITHKGLIRHIFYRKAIHTGEIMAGIVSFKKDVPYLDALTEELKKIKGVTSLILNVNPVKTNVILGDFTEVLYGNPYITDKILGFNFKIGFKSFFQVNPYNVGNLYKAALDFLELNKNDILFDIYCGTGTIGLCGADKVKEIIGVEIIPEAIEYAKENAKINGIENSTFYVGKAEDVIYELTEKENRPTKVILDPPRAGCYESLLQEIIKLSPEKICYVSCDVATLARDLKILTENEIYKVEKIVACDMFPQTAHVESVALLVRADSTAI